MSESTPWPAAAGQPQQLSPEEAAALALELRQQLQAGVIPSADADAIERMVAGLGDARGLMRLTFAESLGAVGACAVPALCAALRHNPSVTVRRAAAKTLTLIADPCALPDLQEALLNDPDPVVQGSAVGAMAAVGAAALDALLAVLVLPGATAMQQGLASWGLAFIGSRAPEALRAAASSPNAAIRTAAVAALGDQIQTLGDDQARQLVLSALADPCPDVRCEAATLLGKLNEPDWAAPRLLPLLQDDEAEVRRNAALSLMKLRVSEAVEPLAIRLDQEPDPGVRAVLELVLTQLTGA